MTDQRIVLFRAECRRYSDYLREWRIIQTELEIIQHKMENVYSPDPRKSAGSVKSGSSRSLVALIAAKDRTLEKSRSVEKKIEWIMRCFYSIPYPAYRALIWRVYVQSNKISDLAEEFGIPTDTLYPLISNIVSGIITDERLKYLMQKQIN
ncbi:MAG: hypothetical protein K6D03_06255 [Solobacterium sp.]|nr:hypothetical protein [Solobacterium sp.]